MRESEALAWPNFVPQTLRSQSQGLSTLNEERVLGSTWCTLDAMMCEFGDGGRIEDGMLKSALEMRYRFGTKLEHWWHVREKAVALLTHIERTVFTTCNETELVPSRFGLGTYRLEIC
jgi:hypothetical protein